MKLLPLAVIGTLFLTGCFGKQREAAPPTSTREADPKAPAFLCLPFPKDTSYQITEGWIYSAQEQAIHGYVKHHGIDFAVLRGTKVLAAADGYAVSSCHFRFPDKFYQGKRIGFGLGKFVQIWHPEEGVFTQYGHLEQTSEDIPYLEPKRTDGEWDPVGIYVPGSSLELGQTKLVKHGELVGYAGDSGLSWGYDETPTTRPNPNKYPSWDEVHLHFEVYIRGEDGLKNQYFDPFGIEGGVDDYQDTAKRRENELWLRNEFGLVFADE